MTNQAPDRKDLESKDKEFLMAIAKAMGVEKLDNAQPKQTLLISSLTWRAERQIQTLNLKSQVHRQIQLTLLIQWQMLVQKLPKMSVQLEIAIVVKAMVEKVEGKVKVKKYGGMGSK